MSSVRNQLVRYNSFVLDFDSTAGSVVDRSNAALRVADSIPTRDKYFYDLRFVVRFVWLFVYMSLNVCKRTYDTRIINSVMQRKNENCKEE